MRPRGRGRAPAPRALSHDHRHASTPRITGAADLAAGAQHRLHAAEEEVRGTEAHEPRIDRLERLLGDARLDVEDAVFEMHARCLHRGAHAEAVVYDADDRLQERRADAVRARAAEHEL